MEYLPYGRQTVTDDDIAAVVKALRSDWLTTGPEVDAFEDEFAGYVRSRHAVAVSNGTAALHLALQAAGIGPGDEVIVPPLTFAATANAALYVGAHPVFADVDPSTFNLSPEAVRAAISPRTAAIVTVDYAGLPSAVEDLRQIASRHDLLLVEDGCHAPGATLNGETVGSIADVTTFSFHPVKHVATGEGGMCTTNDRQLARRIERLRNHGIDMTARQREGAGTWEYDLVEIGHNFRLSDIACALGRSQLRRLDASLSRRREIAARYSIGFAESGLLTQSAPVGHQSAWHLYPVLTSPDRDRGGIFTKLREVGIGVNVHYRPVYEHTAYVERFGSQTGSCPNAEEIYARVLSLPMWPGLSDNDVERVIEEVVRAHG